VPAIPFLLAAGALAASGRVSFIAALGLALAAAVLADLTWYEVGRRWGDAMLRFIHDLSTDPDAADNRSKKKFTRYGSKVLVVAKFVPGLDAAAPPLAGMFRTSRVRFLAFDALGASLWSGAYTALGYAFSRDLNRVAAYAARMGALLTVVKIAAVCIYLACKVPPWYRFIREFRLARITAEELKQKLDAGLQVSILDLQGDRDHAPERQGIPGAVRIDPRRLEQYKAYHRKTPIPLPRDREVILYCNGPDKFTSARVALAMRRHGFSHVRPLAGGLRAWQERGFPVAQELSLWVPRLA
jgi:membrane protein DedA with SNARE-associated domain/rhodanese-related sulfurtransferase